MKVRPILKDEFWGRLSLFDKIMRVVRLILFLFAIAYLGASAIIGLGYLMGAL